VPEVHCPTLPYRQGPGTRTFLQPDPRYIARPYGLERDALVAGVQFEAAF
jgi:carbohydrate-selective porin OprB